MHEMSLAESALQIVEDAVLNQGLKRVTEVRLEIGKLSGVEPEALRLCLEIVFKGSLAEGARVEIFEVAGKGWCMPCQTEVALHALYDPCPHCGNYPIQATGGREMRVKDLLAE